MTSSVATSSWPSCQGHLDFAKIEETHGIRMGDYFRSELAALTGLAQSGLVTFTERSLDVTMAGWFLVRAIAMVFDRHLQFAKERHGFSRVV